MLLKVCLGSVWDLLILLKLKTFCLGHPFLISIHLNTYPPKRKKYVLLRTSWSTTTYKGGVKGSTQRGTSEEKLWVEVEIGESSPWQEWFWKPSLARGTIRRCTNYIIRVSPMLKREVARRCDIPYKRSDRVALLHVWIKSKALSCERIEASFA